MKLLGLLVLLAPLSAHAASSASCDALKQNVLTSATGVCPPACGSSPCVLFSPSQNSTCEAFQTTGPCESYDSFVVPNTDTECNVTYQCLDQIMDSNKKWFLSLTKSTLSDKSVTTAAVTEIQQLKYPTNVSIVQLAGGLGRNAKGNVKNVIFDDSFFDTPPSVVSFFLSEVNLPTFLNKIKFGSVKWTVIALNNANLQEVPAGLSSLSLDIVELSKNFIKVVNDSKPFAKVSSLKLVDNDLTDLNIELPAVVTLNLSGNPLTKIPDSVFRMTKLQTLSMRGCNLTNLQLTEDQFAFLAQRQTFDASPVAINCSSGFIQKNFTSGVGSVCIPGVAPEAQVADNKSSGSSTTGIAIGVAAGVVVVFILAFFLFRRRRSRSNDHYSAHGDKLDTYTNDTEFTMGSGGTDSSIWNDPDLLAVRVEHRDIEPIKLLARGGFGEVWLGLYMNENVAIKRLLNDKKTMNDALAFASEIKTMARLDHPKIVRFIGVSWTNALTIQAVTEFMDCGDLRSLLDSSRASSLTWANLKCQIAIDVADALVYMHTLSPKLIHRDLKSRNVLIDANTGAKLSDFGISRNRSVEETMTAGVGTARWIAPEVILGGHYTEFADIYSFGVVLSELDTSKTPFHDATNTNGAKMQDVTILQLVSAGKLQPSFNTNCPEPIVKLARACMAFDPEQRPSAIHISYELRKILKDEL